MAMMMFGFGFLILGGGIVAARPSTDAAPA